MDRSLQRLEGMTTGFLLGRLAWVALPALVLLGPRSYACNLHPLARLSDSMEPGTPYRTALARFEAYADRTGPGEGGDAVLGDLTPRNAGDGSSPAHILFIQDLWQDEDLALTAWFGPDERLQGVDFTCGG